MSCTNDHAQLEADIPGIYVAFRIPSDVIQNSFAKQETVEINYKRLFRRLTGRKRSSTVDFKHTSPSKDLVAQLDGGVYKPPSSNRFDTLIDRLERKYYAISNVQSSVDMVMVGSEGEDSMSSSQVSTSNPASPDIEMMKNTEGMTPSSSSSKKKKKPVFQDYDYSDPFIDDSVVVTELEEVMNTKKLKTKHDGFFVSSGELEVVKVKKPALVKPVTAPSSSSSTNPPATNSKIHADVPKTTKPSKIATSTVAVPMEIVPTCVKSLIQPLQPAMSSDDKYFTPDSPTAKEVKPKKEKVEKPAWSPHPDVVAELARFKELVTEVLSTSWTKNLTFPASLEAPLLALDAVVKLHHDEKELAKTTGYYETLQAHIGKGFTASKLKTMIIRLQIREKANSVKLKLESLILKLKEQLQAVIIDCPADKQPSNIKSRKPKDASNSNPSADNTAEGADVSEILNDISTELNSSLVQDTSVNLEGEEGKDETPSAENKDGSNDERKPTIEYKFFCPWSLPHRQLLLQIELTVDEWVTHENQYREKLFAADRKYMHSSEYTTLVAADEFTKVLQRICQIFPELCLNGDVTALRKQLRTEKKRIKPKTPTEKSENREKSKEKEKNPASSASSKPILSVTEVIIHK